MKTSRLMCLLLPALALSCAESGGSVYVDAQWNLTCPADREVDCGSLADIPCLGSGGRRAIVGEHRQELCGYPIVGICEAVKRADGTRIVSLEADLGGKFGFDLTGATIDTGGDVVEQLACNVTITEDQVRYNVGACGRETPSMMQPCQLSDISVEGSDVVFGVECRSLISDTTDAGFDVGAVGGGPATIRFANCVGF